MGVETSLLALRQVPFHEFKGAEQTYIILVVGHGSSRVVGRVAGGWWCVLQNEAVTMRLCPGGGCGGEEVAARL